MNQGLERWDKRGKSTGAMVCVRKDELTTIPMAYTNDNFTNLGPDSFM